MPSLTPSRIIKGLLRRSSRLTRVGWFALISSNERVVGIPIKHQAILYRGAGSIKFGTKVNIGVISSPGFWSTYCYLDSRNISASIDIGDGTWINNGFSVIAEKSRIEIGRNCLIGHDVTIYDSNFHSLNPEDRHDGGSVSVGNVIIYDNVFIGSRVIILKNTTIGSGSVVGAGSVVSGAFPENCLIAGNPAVVIRRL